MRPDPIVDRLIRSAILAKRLVQFDYQDAARICEPHDYGTSGGRIRLLVYQLRGRSNGPLPGWRMVDVAGIQNLAVLDDTFAGSRGQTGQLHKQWEELFARVT